VAGRCLRVGETTSAALCSILLRGRYQSPRGCVYMRKEESVVHHRWLIGFNELFIFRGRDIEDR
jgi:hypothetical protein